MDVLVKTWHIIKTELIDPFFCWISLYYGDDLFLHLYQNYDVYDLQCIHIHIHIHLHDQEIK
jgi:hypothetical protein